MEKETSLYSRRIVTEKGVIEGILRFEKGRITALIEHPDSEQIAAAEDWSDCRILPGIIDLHSHGYHSWSAKTIEPDEIQGLSRILPSIGVTATLATTTGWKEHELEMLQAIAGALNAGTEGTRILGIHMEGPFFNPDKHNATPRSEVILPTIEKCEQYWAAADGKIRYMTLAPEMTGAREVIRWLRDHGIVAGAGHTLADDEQMQQAVRDGIQVAIHTGNAMRQIDRREIGALGAALLDPELICEIICDFYHLSPRMLEIMFRIKNNMDRFIMISDSDTLSGVEPGTYFAYGKRVHVHPDGRILLDDGTISGSSKYVLYGMENLIEKLGLPIETVSRMASLNPAELIGIADKKGSLAIGKDADLMILNDAYKVQKTFVEGRQVYQAGDALQLNEHFSQFCQKLE